MNELASCLNDFSNNTTYDAKCDNLIKSKLYKCDKLFYRIIKAYTLLSISISFFLDSNNILKQV